MVNTIGFDVYGTLIDTNGVTQCLTSLLQDAHLASKVAAGWRDKQLEYTFRRGLMDDYQPFPECTRQALDFVAEQLQLNLSLEDRRQLLYIYRQLPAFDDVKDALARLKSGPFRLYAFSNGTRHGVEELLQSAGIDGWFDDIVSVDEIKTFKPSPRVYRHFLTRCATGAEHAWLVSGNSFDICGAHHIGMCTAWIKRNPSAALDPWDVTPTLQIANLTELADQLLSKHV